MFLFHLWSMFELAAMELFTPYRYWYRFRELQRSQYQSRNDLEKMQLTKFQAIYAIACCETPFYQRLYQEGKIPAKIRSLVDLEKLPFMTKRLALSTNPPCNISRASFLKQGIEWGTTTGTSGRPFRFIQDHLKKNDVQFLLMRGQTWMGYQFGFPYAYLSLQDNNTGMRLVRELLIRKFLKYRVNLHCGVLSPPILQNYVNILRKKRVKHLQGYVSAIAALARYVVDNQVDIQLQSVKVLGEMLYQNTRKFIEESLNCEVFESYGSREFGEIALECENHTGLHIYDESFIVEAIRDGQPVFDEEGDLAITDLMNSSQIFMRFMIGDRGVISNELCSCGRRFYSLKSITGRANDTILSPSGKWVSSAHIWRIIEPLDEIIQWQVEQRTREQIVFKLIVHEDNPSFESHIRMNMVKIDPDFDVRIEHVDKITKSSGQKFKIVISPFNPRTDLTL